MRGLFHIAKRLWQRGREAARRARFARAVRHIHGPLAPEIAPDEPLAIVLVKDGAYYLDAFLATYRSMGVRHFAFVDNGSTDGTVDLLRQEPGVIVDQCTLPLAGYEDLLRQYPAQAYGQDRWCFYIDMDEVFDFPGRAALGVPGLIRYLEAQGATALVAQMLEMFPKGPLSAAAGLSFAEALEAFAYFDISTVRRFGYYSRDIPFWALMAENRLSRNDTEFFFGGVRGKVFGENCCLTKHPLVFNGPGVVPAPHPHVSMGVRCADVTAVIKHYKFAGDTAARDAASLASGAVAHGEDAARAAVLAEQGDVTLFSLDARRWNRPELLVRAGFLLGSEAFEAYVAEQDG